MWLKIVQTVKNNVEIIYHKFVISELLFLPNVRDFGMVEIREFPVGFPRLLKC